MAKILDKGAFDEEFHTFDIKVSASGLWGAKILMDGKPVKGVTGLNISSDTQSRTIITLQMVGNLTGQVENARPYMDAGD